MSKSAIASGMGLAMSIITNLIKAVGDAGGTDEDLYWLSKTESFGTGPKLLKKIGELVTRKGEMSPQRYNEISAVLNMYQKLHGCVPPHFVFMEIDRDGMIDSPIFMGIPQEKTQKEITDVIKETAILAEELWEWAHMRQALLEWEDNERQRREYLSDFYCPDYSSPMIGEEEDEEE